VAVYLNLTDDHLDWHKDLEEYRLSKQKLFQIPETDEEQSFTWVLNYDDKVCCELGEYGLWQLAETEQSNLDIAFFSTKNSLVKLNQYARSSAFCENGILYLAKFLPDAVDDQYGGIVEVNEEGHYYVKIPLLKVSDLNLVGEHNYSNLLAGILAADAVGLALEKIIESLKSFTAVPHRLEFIGEHAGHKFYNDSKATNPDSANKALEAFEQSIIICGGKNKNLDLGDFINKLAQKAYAVVLIGELSQELKQGLQERNFEKFSFANDMDEAVGRALDFGKGNQLPIVLAPASSSFDMFKNYEERGEKFKQSFSKLVVSLK
jgi:UDP-N-acetylmuramoylalanine--D-glutamate ligase